MTEKKPTRFEDLSTAELRRSAIEDFAVDVEPDANKKVVIAALAESGVGWSDYVAQHPEAAPVQEETTKETVIRVKEEVVANPEEKFLVKMTRENPLYQTRGYTFTKEHPYQLVSSADVEYILSNEDGFRQAYPSELQEFYG